jgi:hypothetical protein
MTINHLLGGRGGFGGATGGSGGGNLGRSGRGDGVRGRGRGFVIGFISKGIIYSNFRVSEFSNFNVV